MGGSGAATVETPDPTAHHEGPQPGAPGRKRRIGARGDHGGDIVAGLWGARPLQPLPPMPVHPEHERAVRRRFSRGNFDADDDDDDEVVVADGDEGGDDDDDDDDDDDGGSGFCGARGGTVGGVIYEGSKDSSWQERGANIIGGFALSPPPLARGAAPLKSTTSSLQAAAAAAAAEALSLMSPGHAMNAETEGS